MPRVFLPQILWHSKDNKRCDRVYSIDFQPRLKDEIEEKQKNTTTLRLATGGADEFVHIWQITIHDHAPQYTHFVNNNQNTENKLEFEQPLSIKILARLVGHIGEVNSVRWSHDGRTLATGGEDRCIFLWVKGSKQGNLNEDVHNDYEEYWTRTHYFRLSNVVNTICWCPDDRVLSVSTEDGHVSIVDTQVEGTGKIRYFDGHTSFAQGVSLDPKNELLASLGSDQCLRVWKRRNQKMWKSVLVLKAARDRGDIITMNELENNIELRKYSRYVFMSEELKTFFRRLDWSPDGRLLVAPTGIRHDKINFNNTNNTNTSNSTMNNNTNTNSNTSSNNTNVNSMINSNTGSNSQSEMSSNNTSTWDDQSVTVNQTTSTDTNNTPTVNNTTDESASDANVASSQNGVPVTEKSNTAPQVGGENSVYTLYVFHRKLLNFGIPMLTHQSPTGPFVVVKFCPLYLSVFDKKRQNFYNLLLNANKNKLKPIKRKLDRTSKSQLVTTNKINSYFSTVNTKSPPNVMSNSSYRSNDTGAEEDASNQELNGAENEEDEYENNELEQDEDEVMTMLQENRVNMGENMENTTTDTPNNIDNTPSGLEINLEEYESVESNETVNSLMDTPISTTARDDMYTDNSRESRYTNNIESVYSNNSMVQEGYGSYVGNMESVEVNEEVLSSKENDGATSTTLDDYQLNTTTNETENNNEFQVEEMNEWEMEESTEMERMEENDISNEEVDNKVDGDKMDDNVTNVVDHNDDVVDKVDDDTDNKNQSNVDKDNSHQNKDNVVVYKDSSHQNNDGDVQYKKEVYEGEGVSKVKMEEKGDLEGVESRLGVVDEELSEKIDDDDEEENEEEDEDDDENDNKLVKKEYDSKCKMERGDDVDEGVYVKEEGVDENEVNMEKIEDELVKEEGEEDKKKYNLRKTRKSVIPLIMETYKQVTKKTKNKIKKEKKVKSEEIQEEDYDTDLEEELLIPRFLFAAGTTDGSLCFFDTKENSGPIAVLKNLHFCPITDISWSPEGYVCATSSSDGYITFVIFNKRELS